MDGPSHVPHMFCPSAFSVGCVAPPAAPPPRARHPQRPEPARPRVHGTECAHVSLYLSLGTRASRARLGLARRAAPRASRHTTPFWGDGFWSLLVCSLAKVFTFNKHIKKCYMKDMQHWRQRDIPHRAPPSPRPLSSVTYSVPTGPGPSLTWPALASTAGSAHAGSRSGAGLGRPWPPLASTAAAALGWPLS